jgi:hypothetical protein
MQETLTAIMSKYAEFAQCSAKCPLDQQLDIFAVSQKLELGLTMINAIPETPDVAGYPQSLASSLWRQAASQWQQAGRYWHATSYVTPAPFARSCLPYQSPPTDAGHAADQNLTPDKLPRNCGLEIDRLAQTPGPQFDHR